MAEFNATVVYDFESAGPSELALKEGETVKVKDRRLINY